MEFKKERKPLGTKLEAKYVDALKRISDKTGISQVRLLQEGIKYLCEVYDEEVNKN